MKRNPCFRSKDDQCANRHVGCRNTCAKWAEYEAEKNREYEQCKKEAFEMLYTEIKRLIKENSIVYQKVCGGTIEGFYEEVAREFIRELRGYWSTNFKSFNRRG